MAQDNTGLLALLLGGGTLLYFLSKGAAPAIAATSPNQATTRAGGSGGGSGGGFSSGGGGGSGQTYSGSNPQSAQAAAGQPSYGPTNPATDPCNENSAAYDLIQCTNNGGNPYTDSTMYVSCNDGSLVTDISQCPENQEQQYAGDPCDDNPLNVNYNADLCAELSGASAYGVDTSGGGL